MSQSKSTVDHMRQALSAVNLIEEPVTYQQYLDTKNNPTEDSEYDMDMKAEPEHPDHEVNMAKSDMYKAMRYALDIYKMLERVSEQEGIEGWVAAKMTKASDYLSSVKHYIEHEMAQADMSGESRHNNKGDVLEDVMNIEEQRRIANAVFTAMELATQLDVDYNSDTVGEFAEDLLTAVEQQTDESIEEKAVSKAQQQAAGAALAAKRGDAPKSKLQGASKEMMKMSTKELEKYAGTKHKGLPKTKESIGEATMTDNNKKLMEGIRIQTDSLEDQIALMTIMKNAGLDPQQMNIQQQPSQDMPAPDMTPDVPAEIPGEEPKNMPMDEPEAEAFDNEPNEKFLDKDDYELKRNVKPNSDMGPASAKHGDNPMEAINRIAEELNKEYELFKEGRVKDMMLDMEADAADMSKEEFVKAHGERYAYIWDRVQGQMAGDPQYDESRVNEGRQKDEREDMEADASDMSKEEFIKTHGERYAYIWDRVHDEMMEGDSELEDIMRLSGRGDAMEAKKSKPDYLDFDKDGDTKEPMKKALKDKEKK